MKVKVYIVGVQEIPKEFQNQTPKEFQHQNQFETQLIKNQDEMINLIADDRDDKILVVYLPFLEMRHFEIFHFLQRKKKNLQTFFVVDEISETMKLRLKGLRHFVVLWRNEEEHLISNIQRHLEGQEFSLRRDRRESLPSEALVSPALLPSGKTFSFKPILAGALGNVSLHGSCIKMKVPFYKPEELVDITYRNKEGQYQSIQGQVRWIRWNDQSEMQDVGIQFKKH